MTNVKCVPVDTEEIRIASIDYDTRDRVYYLPKKYCVACYEMLKRIGKDFVSTQHLEKVELFRFFMHNLEGLFVEDFFGVFISKVRIDKKGQMVLPSVSNPGCLDDSTGEAVCFDIEVPTCILKKTKFFIPKEFQFMCMNTAAQIAAQCPKPCGEKDDRTKRLMFGYILERLEELFRNVDGETYDCVTVQFEQEGEE